MSTSSISSTSSTSSTSSINSNSESLNLQPPPETRTVRHKIGKWFANKLRRTNKKAGTSKPYKTLPYKSEKRTPLTKTSGERLVPDRPLHKRVWSGIRGLAGKTKKQINATLHKPKQLAVTYTHRTTSGKSIESGSNTKKFKPDSRLKINLPESPLNMPAPRYGQSDLTRQFARDFSHIKRVLTRDINDNRVVARKNTYPVKFYWYNVHNVYNMLYNPNADHMLLIIGSDNFYSLDTVYNWTINNLNENNVAPEHINNITKAYTLIKSKHLLYNNRHRYNYFKQGERAYTPKHKNYMDRKTQFGTINIEDNDSALRMFVDATNNAFASVKTSSETDD